MIILAILWLIEWLPAIIGGIMVLSLCYMIIEWACKLIIRVLDWALNKILKDKNK